MNQSEHVNEIAAALAKAQAGMQHAALDGINPHFKSKYATLAAVCNACKSALSKEGIAFTQYSHESTSGVSVETIFYHSSGQWIGTGRVFVPVDKKSAHGIGSAMTYARRYALSMACGIAAEDDDDGNMAASAPPPKKATRTIDDALDGIEIDWNEASEYIAGIEAAVHNEDVVGLNQLMTELTDNEMKMAVWSKLDSKTRSFIKSLKDAA